MSDSESYLMGYFAGAVGIVRETLRTHLTLNPRITNEWEFNRGYADGSRNYVDIGLQMIPIMVDRVLKQHGAGESPTENS